jgi:ADP-heptose:LPS heptosyltransferase
MRFHNGRGVLIVCHQGLGDTVQSLPLIKAVCRWARGRWPVRILFGSQPYSELIQEEGLELIPYYFRPKYQTKRGLLRLCLDLMGTTDLIICPPELSAVSLALFRVAIGARYAAGEADVPFDRLLSFSVKQDWNKSFLKTQEELAARIGLQVPLDVPSITLTLKELRWARSQLRQSEVREDDLVIGVHCSSAVADKKWPAVNFGELVRRLKAVFPNLSAISFGAIEERADAERSHEAAGSVNWVEGTGQWTIRQTLAMLGQCDLFLSGDTGLMHMAAAVGTQTLSIFGPTSPARRAPTYRGGLAVAPITDCHPCYRSRWKGCTCIRLVDVDRVATLAQQCLLRPHRTRFDGSLLQDSVIPGLPSCVPGGS